VLRSLKFKPGDELLTTNHAYNACKNALHFAADSNGAKVVVAEVPFPVQNAAEITAAILKMATPRTKIVLLDHVTSPTALIFPVQQIVQELAARGIDTLIDGAHAPGMVPLNIEAIGAAYYTGNCHKWLCAPKGAGFLHVRGDKQAAIRPTAISHGANSMRTDRSRYLLEFDWTGTVDYSPYLCIGDALEFMASLLPGGWPAVMARNHELACDAREILCRELKVAPPCPPALLGSMATVPLPGDIAGAPTPLGTDPLQDALFFKHGIEVPIMRWKDSRLVRVSCQLYNERAHYEKLAAALVALLR
jgi:isopenicillin-N epimerase